MKKKLTRAYALFWAVLAGYLFLSFSSNPPNDRTGAPPSFTTCASATGGCHSGGTGMGNVMVTGLPASIDPNTTYPITVTVTRTNGVPMMGGFQMVVLDDNDNNIGTLSNPGGSSTTSTSGGRTFFEHNPAKSFGGGNDVTYTVDWTSPSSGGGEITMYAAALLANGNGGSSGDVTVTTTSAGNFMGGGGQITVDVTGTDVSCFGGNDGSATAIASGGGGGPYTYSWSNGMMGSTINNLTAGTYTVTATNATGTPGTAMITINQPNELQILFSPDEIEIELGDSLTRLMPIVSQGAAIDSFIWTPNDFLSDPGIQNPFVVNLIQDVEYTLTVIDVNGCSATGNIFVELDANRNVYIPNVFSPNGDGPNDEFRIFPCRGVTNINFAKIFDRWGELVFEDTNLAADCLGGTRLWDGTLNGRDIKPGVYVYLIEIEFLDGIKLLYRGDVTLLR